MKREFSLASKLAALDVGQVISLDDGELTTGATNMERQVQSIVRRNKRLVDRKFTTTRGDLITVHRQHIRILRIERVG